MIVVAASDASRLSEAGRAALDACGGRVVETVPTDGSVLALVAGTPAWSIVDPSVRRGAQLCLDFAEPGLVRRVATTWNAHEPLRQALGAPKGQGWTVLDATGGLGRDAWMLAAWGHDVVTCERHPLLAWLLGEALVAVGAPPSPRLHVGDARTASGEFRVVHLDPMFPDPEKRSALPSGELQLLRRLLHDAPGDDDTLLAWALDTATHRVVVKRPRHAPTLDGPRLPSHQLEGRAGRYDVYVKR